MTLYNLLSYLPRYYVILSYFQLIAYQFGLSPIIGAAKSGHLQILKLLLESGADINAGDVVSYLSIYLPIYLFVRLSVRLSICLSVCLSLLHDMADI